MAKSSNGSGSYYQKKTGGPWYFRMTIGKSPEGKQLRKQYGPFRTKTEARDQHDQLREQVRRGEVALDRGNPTVGSFLRSWIDGLAVNKSVSTVEFYRTNLERYVLPSLADVRLQKLKGSHLTELYGVLLKDGGSGKALSPTTVRHIHGTLRTAFGQAIREGLIARAPTDNASAPTVKSSRGSARVNQQTWTPEQVRTFLDHVAGDRQFALWRLAFTTGRRRGELLGLRWRNVDLNSSPPTIRIVEQRGYVSLKGIVEGSTKTAGSAGTLALDSTTAEALRAHRVQQIKDRMSLGVEFSENDRVFTNPDGTDVHPPRVSKRFRQLLDLAGLPRIRYHDIRHTYATCALADGVPVKVVSQRLGHSDVGITLSTYAHVMPQHDAAAAEQVASLFG